MCGIAGLVLLDGSPLPAQADATLQNMARQMRHRGPDGEGFWRSGPVGLAHRRLSIIDLAGGRQPMHYDGRLTIVFNGEIYNYRELRSELARDGAVFTSNSDTEVILAAYDRYGTGCLEHLEGMFAFALWDHDKRQLFAARDHFGKKPFYYTIQNGCLAFSSDLKSLAMLESCEFAHFSFGLSSTSIVRYLAYEYTPTPDTMYKEIKSLPPAHCLCLAAGKPEISRYWDLPAPDKAHVPAYEDAAAELRALLARAVRMRMISDVPLGVFLSGGIDSSIVTGLMACQSTRPVQTFSIGFREASYDESRYARIVADAFQTSHHEQILSADDCAQELPQIIMAMDTPLADASCAPTWLLSRLARNHVTVALGGDGADELWAGYEHYIGFRMAIWYNALPRWLRRGLVEPVCKRLPASAGYINPRLAVKTFLEGAAAPDWLRVQTMLTALSPEVQEQVLAPRWLHEYQKNGGSLRKEYVFAPTRHIYDSWHRESGAKPLARAFYVYARQFMLDDILVKVDRCSMLHSLEVRAPFLDRRVAEFSARLPLDYKLHGFRRKYLLKRAFKDLLPPAILKRNKRGFQIPVAGWLRGKLKPLLCDMLARDRLVRQGIFDAQAVEKLMQAHFSGESDLRKPLWTLLVLQLWLDSAVRGKS